jgi:hypothetical protein
MPPDRASEFRFWESVGYRLLAILLIGLGMILLFRGCVVPAVKDEMRQDQQKTLDTRTVK